LAEGRVGEHLDIVVEAHEWANEIGDIADGHLLQAGDEIVDDRKPHEGEEISDRHPKEDMEQRRARPPHSPSRRRCRAQSGVFARIGLILSEASLSAGPAGLAPTSASWMAVCIARDMSGHCGCGPRARAVFTCSWYIS